MAHSTSSVTVHFVRSSAAAVSRMPLPDGSTVPVTLGELRALYATRRRTRQLRRLVKRLVKELRDARADHAALAADVAEDAQLDLLSQLYEANLQRAGLSAA